MRRARGFLVLALLHGAARADSSVPAATATECYDPAKPECFPMISEDGKTVAVRTFAQRTTFEEERTGPQSEIRLYATTPPFVVVEHVPLGEAEPRLRSGRFRQMTRALPQRDFVFAWGARPKPAVQSDAFGLTFRVARFQLSITRAGKLLFAHRLSQPGVECYELSPYAVSVWFDPKERLLAIRTYGDKCMTLATDWAFARVP